MRRSMGCSLLLAVGLYLGFDPATATAQLGDLLKGLKSTIEKQRLSDDEIVRGLKEALQIGTGNAVEVVSKVDGYFGNPKIRIPLPGAVQKLERILRAAGYGPQLDAFLLSMNRAAEKAAPEAKAIFWKAITQMTFSDAREILYGRDDEATRYFQRKTRNRLKEIFKPIVHEAMSQVGVTRRYQELDAKVHSIPFAGQLSFDLDQYVTEGALKGLFHMLAQEEKKIRRNPTARITPLLQKVFGAPREE